MTVSDKTHERALREAKSLREEVERLHGWVVHWRPRSERAEIELKAADAEIRRMTKEIETLRARLRRIEEAARRTLDQLDHPRTDRPQSAAEEENERLAIARELRAALSEREE